MTRNGGQAHDHGLDEPVHLEEHDPGWSERFAVERARLRALVDEDARLEHIGSTAVPGLVAKPIIDILVGVGSNVPLESVGERLTHAGYELLGEAGVPGRCHLRRRGRTSFNVSVVHVGSSLWSDNLRLRDHLRSDASARRRYADAKRRAVADGHTTLLAYSRAKRATVAELLSEATANTRGDV